MLLLFLELSFLIRLYMMLMCYYLFILVIVLQYETGFKTLRTDKNLLLVLAHNIDSKILLMRNDNLT